MVAVLEDLRHVRTDAAAMKFAALLKELRTKAGLTQPELADRAGIPLTTLQGHEQGRRLPNFPTAVRLARALGVSLDELAKCDEAADSEPAPKKRTRK